MQQTLSIPQRLTRKRRYLKRRYSSWRRETGRERRSIYFFTFHKCASSLFGSFVLPNVRHVEHVDFERMIYAGKIDEADPQGIKFENEGELYGPIRLSGGAVSPAAQRMLSTASRDFVRDKIAVSLIRDPRDILVSRYFSFAFSHGESAVAHIAERQRQNKEMLVSLGVDAYAIEAVEGVRQDFELIDQIGRDCADSVLLRYEDMLTDFDMFAERLTRYMVFSDDVLHEIHRRSRPRKTEDLNSHKRSGQSGTFAEKLKPETVAIINDRLASVLTRFGYTN